MADSILIVDDTPANVHVLLNCLGDAGYRLHVAEDGEEALAQTAQTAPDLILLDVMMPGLDGFETCRRLKAAPTTRDVPVIFMTALHDTPDKLAGFRAGAVDYLTKPVQHEEALARVATHLALRRARRELAAEVALKERFMRIAAHDLRNQLCLVLMGSKLLQGSPRLGAADGEFVGDIHEAATQMRRIIDTFLQLQPGLTGGAGGRLDLPALAKGVCQQYARTAKQKRIELTVDLAEGLPAVRGEAVLLYQAITNYVSNALKFAPPGGNVVVGGTITADGARVKLMVADDGPGVPPAERGSLFREYGRLSPRPSAGEESHGLGLSIVKQLIEGQGGTVGAEFPATGGSRFWLELPVT